MAGRAVRLRMGTAFVGLGANLGDRLGTMRRAVRRLGDLGEVTALSSVYETDPVGYAEQPSFLNAVARLTTPLEPGPLVRALLGIEADLGRVRTFPNAPRLLDLDLLFYDDLVLAIPDLTLPHPRLHQRAFVLVPLAEIAPDLDHPVLARRMTALRAQVDPAGVRRAFEPLALLSVSSSEPGVRT